MKLAQNHLSELRDGRTGRETPRCGGGFSLIELLTVIAIIGILAAIGAGLAGVASRKSKEAATKAGRDKLVTSIESYRYDFNQYPPDNAKNGRNVNPAVNPLYYELAGTISSQQGRYYRLTDHDERLSAGAINRLFNRKGFLNSAEAPKKPKSYLVDLKDRQRAEIAINGVGHADLLVSPVEWPMQKEAWKNAAPLRGVVSDPRLLRLNPWQYVSTRPVHNQNSFDLWSDVVIGKERQIIGNWQSP